MKEINLEVINKFLDKQTPTQRIILILFLCLAFFMVGFLLSRALTYHEAFETSQFYQLEYEECYYSSVGNKLFVGGDYAIQFNNTE